MPGRQLVARWWEDLAVVYMYTIDTHCVRCCRIWSRRLPHRSPRSCHGLPGRTGQTRRQPVGRPASNCTGPTGARSARSRSRRPRRSTCRPAQCRRPRRTEGWCAGRGARAWLQLRVPWLPVVLVVSGRCGCVVVAVVVAVVVVVAARALADAISVCTRVSLRQCLHFVIDSTEADLDLRSKSCPIPIDTMAKANDLATRAAAPSSRPSPAPPAGCVRSPCTLDPATRHPHARREKLTAAREERGKAALSRCHVRHEDRSGGGGAAALLWRAHDGDGCCCRAADVPRHQAHVGPGGGAR